LQWQNVCFFNSQETSGEKPEVDIMIPPLISNASVIQLHCIALHYSATMSQNNCRIPLVTEILQKRFPLPTRGS